MSSSEIAVDLTPLLIIYKDGHIERLQGTDVVPAGYDPKTHVDSKDVVISKDEDVRARLYLPKHHDPHKKLPLLFHIHGGGFCIHTPFDHTYHDFLNAIVSKAHVVGVSIHYKLAPEFPIPIAFDDSWTALKWVASHSSGKGPEEWLNRYADFQKVFFSGDSAGATIAHNLALRAGTIGLPGVNIEGIALVNPYFWGEERIGSENEKPHDAELMGKIWQVVSPNRPSFDDPLFNPAKDPNVAKIATKKVLITVSENDVLKDRGWYYKETLDKNGWDGFAIELLEIKGEGHVFHLDNPDSAKAIYLREQIAFFFNS